MTEDKWPTERVSKLDVARRQLRTAIRLFFEEDDSISIHTLTAASHEIFRALVKFKGGASMMKDGDFIRPERREWLLKRLDKPYNFFKHGARDPHETLEFSPENTPFWIFDCIMMDRKLRGDSSYSFQEFVVFMIWFTVQYPDLLNEETSALLSAETLVEYEKIRKSGASKQLCLTLIRHPERYPMNYNSAC